MWDIPSEPYRPGWVSAGGLLIEQRNNEHCVPTEGQEFGVIESIPNTFIPEEPFKRLCKHNG